MLFRFDFCQFLSQQSGRSERNEELHRQLHSKEDDLLYKHVRWLFSFVFTFIDLQGIKVESPEDIHYFSQQLLLIGYFLEPKPNDLKISKVQNDQRTKHIV